MTKDTTPTPHLHELTKSKAALLLIQAIYDINSHGLATVLPSLAYLTATRYDNRSLETALIQLNEPETDGLILIHTSNFLASPSRRAAVGASGQLHLAAFLEDIEAGVAVPKINNLQTIVDVETTFTKLTRLLTTKEGRLRFLDLDQFDRNQPPPDQLITLPYFAVRLVYEFTTGMIEANHSLQDMRPIRQTDDHSIEMPNKFKLPPDIYQSALNYWHERLSVIFQLAPDSNFLPSIGEVLTVTRQHLSAAESFLDRNLIRQVGGDNLFNWAAIDQRGFVQPIVSLNS